MLLLALATLVVVAAPPHAWTRTSKPWPQQLPVIPSLAPPRDAYSLILDHYQNYWCLAPANKPNLSQVMILPAQNPGVWTPLAINNVGAGAWRWLITDAHGAIWLAGPTQMLRHDPRQPARGWLAIHEDAAFPKGNINAIAVSPTGGVVTALTDGTIIEADVINGKVQFHQSPGPRVITRLITDAQGVLWADTGGERWQRPLALESWQRQWEELARMPGSNHDISAAVLDTTLYIAGGLTNEWGYPPQRHAYQHLFAYTPDTDTWRQVTYLGQVRIFAATCAFNDEVWIIGGDVMTADGTRRTVCDVQIWNPKTGVLRDGPTMTIPRPTPVAAVLNGRLYVVGNPAGKEKKPGQMESIGPDETTWRREPDGPTGMGNLVGTALDNMLYLAVPQKCLAVFDAITGTWETITVPHPPRSCQMAAYDGEIWLMGGRGVPDGTMTQIYTPAMNAWRTGPPLPRELAWGAAAVVQGRLIITGGAAGRCFSDRTFRLRKEAIAP